MNKRIAEIRRNAGLSQEDFGARLDVTQNYVWMIESGKRVPSERLLKSICREFGINEHWLRTGEGQMTVAIEGDILLEIADSRKLSKTQRALLLDIMNSPPEEVDAVISFMNRLSSYLKHESTEEEVDAKQQKIPPEPPPKTREEQVEAEAEAIKQRIIESNLAKGEKAPESGTPPDGTGIA